MNQKPTKVWIYLMVLPIPSIIILAVFSAIFRFALGPLDEVANSIINIFMFLFGGIATLLLMLFPLWLVLYIVATNHNNKLKKQQ